MIFGVTEDSCKQGERFFGCNKPSTTIICELGLGENLPFHTAKMSAVIPIEIILYS